jgi:glycosyltransferase involved in cell wall biosynthesis
MKILQVNSNLGNGGAEKITIELSNELAKNHDVTLVSFRDIELHWLFPKLIDPKVKLITLGKNDGFSIGIYFKLFKIFKVEKPDIIHFHLDSTLKYVIPLIKFFPKSKYFYTIHSKLIPINFNNFKKINAVYSIFCKHLNIICISKSIKNDFSQKFPKINFNLIENGVSNQEKTEKFDDAKNEIDIIRKSEKNKILLAVGRFSDTKNFKLLYQTLKLFEGINIQCIIIGDYKNAPKAYWKELENLKPSNIHYIGIKENVIDYMLNADALIMSSKYEGMPITVIEALSVGLPVVSTPAGGVKDIIENNKNGILSDGFEIKDFEKIINTFLNMDSKLLLAISEENKITFKERFDINICAKNHLNLYYNS